VPLEARLVAEAGAVPTWLLTFPSVSPERQAALRERGVDIVMVDKDSQGRIDLDQALARLGERGLTRLLVEGGGQLAASLLRAGLVDRLVWMRAPRVIGGDGIPAVAALGLDRLAGAPGFERMSIETIDGEVIETFRAAEA
jgi:diaminohydroxyphosphoribosylaminopyrimidine deaminase/5-amino-6-(5-phosphoribosylamino)uracil reductase